MALGRLFKLALPITRRILESQLYDWIMAVSVTLDQGGTGIGPFATAALATVDPLGRAIDMPLSQLVALDAGATMWIESFKDFLRWEPTSTLVADNITIFDPTNNPDANHVTGRLVRELVPALEFQTQVLGWRVDAAAGNDENTGLVAAPLKTFNEYRRRIGGQILSSQTVTINGNLGATDVLDVELLDTGTNTLTVQGNTTIAVANQTISAYTPRAPATNVQNLLTPLAAITWTNFVGNGFLVQPQAGTAAGKRATVLLDTGGGPPTIARMATFIAADSSETQPLANDLFDILAIPTVANAKLGTWSTNVQINFINFVTNGVEINAGPGNTLAAQPSPNLQFNYCCFTEPPVLRGSPSFVGCQFMKAISGSKFAIIGGGRCRFNGCAFFDPAHAAWILDEGCLATFSNGTIFQTTAITCFASTPTANNMGFFDTVVTAIRCRRGTNLIANTLYGNTGAGNPIACTLDRLDHAVLTGAGQTLTNGGGLEINMPGTANTTWAAVRAAGGVNDVAPSNASAMVES